jgi:hypothetical protein
MQKNLGVLQVDAKNYKSYIWCKVKVTSKFHPRTGLEDPERE